MSGSSRSPARNSVRRLRRCRGRRGAAPSGSSFLIARIAVGAVNSALDPVLGDDPPERAGVGGADRLALVEHGRGADDQRRVDDVGVADDPADVGGRPPHLAGVDVVDVRHRPGHRDRVAAVVAHDPLRLAGGAGGVEDVERVGRGDLDAAGAGRARRRASPRPSRGRGPRPASASACGRCLTTTAAGWCSASSRARSSSGLYSTTRVGSMPQEAATTTLGRASSMRTASSLAANPPKTTECTAPSRAQASIAMTASGTIGM